MNADLDHRPITLVRSPQRALAFLWLALFWLALVLSAHEAVAELRLGDPSATAISHDRGHATILSKRDAFRLLTSVDRGSASKGKINASPALPTELFDLERDLATGVHWGRCQHFLLADASAAYDARGPPLSTT